MSYYIRTFWFKLRRGAVQKSRVAQVLKHILYRRIVGENMMGQQAKITLSKDDYNSLYTAKIIRSNTLPMHLRLGLFTLSNTKKCLSFHQILKKNSSQSLLHLSLFSAPNCSPFATEQIICPLHGLISELQQYTFKGSRNEFPQ